MTFQCLVVGLLLYFSGAVLVVYRYIATGVIPMLCSTGYISMVLVVYPTVSVGSAVNIDSCY